MMKDVLKLDKKKYVYWQEEDMWLGYLEEYPDYKTQGESLEELKENLKDIYQVCQDTMRLRNI
jgi:predicted RNase H-like HicB family nuclease